MGDLLLPARVQREIIKEKWAEQRAQQRALVERMLDFDDPVCREWAPVLAKLDPMLRLGRARPQAYEPGVSVTPGFYHWVRENEGAPWTVTPITAPDGVSFAEPDSRLLAQLEGNDLQDPRVWRALIEQAEQAEAERERREDERLREMNETVYEKFLAGTRTQVSMNSDSPWTQNAAGRRDAKGRNR